MYLHFVCWQCFYYHILLSCLPKGLPYELYTVKGGFLYEYGFHVEINLLFLDRLVFVFWQKFVSAASLHLRLVWSSLTCSGNGPTEDSPRDKPAPLRCRLTRGITSSYGICWLLKPTSATLLAHSRSLSIVLHIIHLTYQLHLTDKTSSASLHSSTLTR